MAGKAKSAVDAELAALEAEFAVAKAETEAETPVTKTPERKAAEKSATLEQKRRTLAREYTDESKIAVTISPFYAPYLSRVARVSVNGIMVEVPANGKTYMINKTHADHILAKIRKIDDMLARQQRASEVSKNLEHSPGELHI